MSKIEWTEKTWNPIVGCSVVSPGCTNCYAMTMAARLDRMGLDRYRGLTKPSKAGPVWTGETRLVDEALTEPLRRRKPTMWFVNSMSDLFHESVPDAWIDRVFAVMALCPQHTMQVLTKRSARMRAYMNDPHTPYRVAKAMDGVLVDLDHDPVERWAAIPGYAGYEASTHGGIRSPSGPLATGDNPLHEREQVTLWNGGAPRTWFVHALVLMAHRGLPPEGYEARHRNGDKRDNRLANLLWGTRSDNQADKVRHGSIGGPQKLTLEQVATIRVARANGSTTQQGIADQYGISRSLVSMIESNRVWSCPISWPLKSVWIGVSTEDQRRADERVPDLLATPAAVRFVSAEPLLGPIDFRNIPYPSPPEDEGRRGSALDGHEVAGLVGNCIAYVPALDWIIVGGESGPGARPMHPAWARSIRDQCEAAGVPFFFKQWGSHRIGEHDEDVSPCIVWQDGEHEFFGEHQDIVYHDHWLEKDAAGKLTIAYPASKKVAGRLLDGVEHNGMPSTTTSEAAA